MAEQNIDRLLAAIKAEARALEAEGTALEMPEYVDLADAISEIKLSGLDRIDIRDEYNLAELLEADDRSLVANLFRALLQREVDDDGLRNYLGALRGGASKARIFLSIISSAEAAEKGVKVFDGPWLRVDRLKNNRILRRLWLHSWDFRQALVSQRKRHFKEQTSDLKLAMLQVVNAIRQVLESLNRSSKEQQEQIASLRLEGASQKKQISNLQYRLAYLSQQLSTEVPSATVENRPPKIYDNNDVDAFYVAFEDACRGSREEIELKLNRWLDYLPSSQAHSKNVLDIGCGRGEWLGLLSKHGYSALGLDVNPVMVASCIELGFNAKVEDALFWLEQQPSESLTAVTAFHVVEHIPFELLLRWTVEAHRVLERGGVLIYETPNPENLLVASHTFYHDPTHKNPITPTLLEFLASYTGFLNAEIIRLHPYPESAKVKGIDPLTDRVNGHLCGPQDFALVAYKDTGRSL